MHANDEDRKHDASVCNSLDEHAFYDCVRTNSDDIFRGSLGTIYVPAVGRDRYHGSSYLRRTQTFPSIRKCHLLVRWNFSLSLSLSPSTSPKIGALLLSLIIGAALIIWTSSDLRQSLSTHIVVAPLAD